MLLRALRSRNYRLYFTGQAVSLTGSWMTRIATSWLVYRLTGSAWMLGVVGFAGQIPNFVLGPLGGVHAGQTLSIPVLLDATAHPQGCWGVTLDAPGQPPTLAEVAAGHRSPFGALWSIHLAYPL